MKKRPEHDRPEGGRTVVFGVLGGVASGKSTVARLLAGESGLVLDADRLAREALDSPAMRERLRKAWGPGVLRSDGSVDRDFLAERVFADPSERRRLEDWIHPLVRARISESLAEAREQGVGRVVLDVPLLLENDARHGLTRVCDSLVFVEVPADERERRAARDRGWAPGEVARREAAQMPLEEKRNHADHVVPNTGTRAELEEAVRAVLRASGVE